MVVETSRKFSNFFICLHYIYIYIFLKKGAFTAIKEDPKF